MFSAIEFVRDISDTGKPTKFDKNHWKLIPSCSRIYGDDNNQLGFYFEYYSNQNAGDTIQFTYEVKDDKDDIVASETISHKITKHNGFVGQINLEKLKPGLYDLMISTPAYRKNKLVSTSGSFNISWSALAMVEYDIDTAIEQLRYIANSEELDELRNSTNDQVIKLWTAFWKSRDPSPGTEENELRDEYYRRIAYSNKNFSLAGKDGWKTDMGMIHIIYGEPDDIERHPFDIDTKPFELWYYYNPRRRFLFVDEKGYGEYILQYPQDGDINKPLDFREGRP